jgi:hypothetical protein
MIPKGILLDTLDGTPILVENLKVHLLAKNCRFSFEDRKMAAQQKRSKTKIH